MRMVLFSSDMPLLKEAWKLQQPLDSPRQPALRLTCPGERDASREFVHTAVNTDEALSEAVGYSE